MAQGVRRHPRLGQERGGRRKVTFHTQLPKEAFVTAEASHLTISSGGIDAGSLTD